MKIAATIALKQASKQSWDVIVVGAGPAGALTARQLALRGRRVLLVDKAGFPRTKVCGCCLSGSALSTLRSVGLGDLTSRLDAVPLRSILLSSNRRAATLPLPDGAALSREAFDAALVYEAIAAGSDFLPETLAAVSELRSLRKVELQQRTQKVSIEARIVVAADGLAGRFSASEQASVASTDSRIGAGAIAAEAPAFFETGTIYMACSPSGYVGLVRLEDGRLDIAAALDPAAVRSLGNPAAVCDRILKDTLWPAIDGLTSLSWRGTPPLTRQRGWLSAERLFIVGDAAGYVEPFTGEGMGWALNSATALAPLVDKAVDCWNPAMETQWARIHERLLGTRQRSCRLVALALRTPSVTRVVIGVLSLAPALARPFIRRLNRTPALA